MLIRGGSSTEPPKGGGHTHYRDETHHLPFKVNSAYKLEMTSPKAHPQKPWNGCPRAFVPARISTQLQNKNPRHPLTPPLSPNPLSHNIQNII